MAGKIGNNYIDYSILNVNTQKTTVPTSDMPNYIYNSSIYFGLPNGNIAKFNLSPSTKANLPLTKETNMPSQSIENFLPAKFSFINKPEYLSTANIKTTQRGGRLINYENQSNLFLQSITHYNDYLDQIQSLKNKAEIYNTYKKTNSAPGVSWTNLFYVGCNKKPELSNIMIFYSDYYKELSGSTDKASTAIQNYIINPLSSGQSINITAINNLDAETRTEVGNYCSYFGQKFFEDIGNLITLNISPDSILQNSTINPTTEKFIKHFVAISKGEKTNYSIFNKNEKIQLLAFYGNFLSDIYDNKVLKTGNFQAFSAAKQDKIIQDAITSTISTGTTNKRFGVCANIHSYIARVASDMGFTAGTTSVNVDKGKAHLIAYVQDPETKKISFIDYGTVYETKAKNIGDAFRDGYEAQNGPQIGGYDIYNAQGKYLGKVDTSTTKKIKESIGHSSVLDAFPNTKGNNVTITGDSTYSFGATAQDSLASGSSYNWIYQAGISNYLPQAEDNFNNIFAAYGQTGASLFSSGQGIFGQAGLTMGANYSKIEMKETENAPNGKTNNLEIQNYGIMSKLQTEFGWRSQKMKLACSNAIQGYAFHTSGNKPYDFMKKYSFVEKFNESFGEWGTGVSMSYQTDQAGEIYNKLNVSGSLTHRDSQNSDFGLAINKKSSTLGWKYNNNSIEGNIDFTGLYKEYGAKGSVGKGKFSVAGGINYRQPTNTLYEKQLAWNGSIGMELDSVSTEKTKISAGVEKNIFNKDLKINLGIDVKF